MSETGVLQLIQTNFTRYENYSTRLQGLYKMRLIHVAVSHPSNGGNATHTFQVDIQQLNGVLDNRNQMTFIYNNNGADMLSSTLHFNEVMINGQFTFSGLNMGVLTGLVLTFEFEKC